MNDKLAKAITSFNLTPMETEIFYHLATGKRRKEISETIYLSQTAVRNYLVKIYAKLEVNNAVGALGKVINRLADIT